MHKPQCLSSQRPGRRATRHAWSEPGQGRDDPVCFGHRRLAAVKHLGWKEVEVDVVKLSDKEMALQGLIENLQREELNDADRGDGIAAYIGLNAGVDDLSSVQSHGGRREKG